MGTRRVLPLPASGPDGGVTDVREARFHTALEQALVNRPAALVADLPGVTGLGRVLTLRSTVDEALDA